MKLLSHVRLFVTPWTVAYQALLSMGFSRQEYWSELPFPSSGDLPDPRIEPVSSGSPALAGGFFTTAPPKWKVSNPILVPFNATLNNSPWSKQMKHLDRASSDGLQGQWV